MPAFAEAELSVKAILSSLELEHEREVSALWGEIAQLRQETAVLRPSGLSDPSAQQPDASPRYEDDRPQREVSFEVQRCPTAESPVVVRTGAINSGCNLLTPRRAVVVEGGSVQAEPSTLAAYPNPSASSSLPLDAAVDDGLETGIVSDKALTPHSRNTSRRLPTHTSTISYNTCRSRSTKLGGHLVSHVKTIRSRGYPEVAKKLTMALNSVTDLNDPDQSEKRWLSRHAQALEAHGSHLRVTCLRIIANQKFDSFLGFVIILNSFFIGLESLTVPADKRDATVLNPNKETLPYLVAETIFLFIYVFELSLRFFALRMQALASGWVKFDLVLVIIGISGSWIFPLLSLIMSSSSGSEIASVPMVLRVFRLARLARALRLFAQFRTLWMLVHGLISSVSTIINVFLVLFLTIYVFSCISMEMITNSELANNGGEFEDLVQKYWRNLPVSMLTLIQCVSFDSIGGIYAPMIQDDPKLIFFFVPFLLIVSIVLMNLVTAVIVEAFLEHAKQDNELRKKERDQTVRNMMPHLEEVFESLDKDGSGMLTLEELMNAPKREREELASLLDSDSLIELWEMLDTDGDGQVNVQEFCDGILSLTLSNQPVALLRVLRQIAYMREEMELIAAVVAPDRSTRARRMSNVIAGLRSSSNQRPATDSLITHDAPAAPEPRPLSERSIDSEGY